MHARLSWGKVDHEQWDEFEESFDANMNRVGKVDGLRARLLLRDTSSPDAAFTLSIWENEVAMRAYEDGEDMQNTIAPMLRKFFGGEHSTSHCEVKYMEVWPSAAEKDS